MRHARIRRRVGEAETGRLFGLAGLVLRAPVTADAGTAPAALLDALLPAAPSGRYAFAPIATSPLVPIDASDAQPRRSRAPEIAAGFFAAVAIAVGGVALGLRPASGPAAAASATSATSAPTSRAITVQLPFVASGAQLDGVDHPLRPAASAFAVELEIAAERRHRLVATAVDGARAEAVIVEDGPIGKIEPGSLAFTLAPSAAQPPSAPAKTSAKATPPGTVRGGFTRLP